MCRCPANGYLEAQMLFTYLLSRGQLHGVAQT